MIARMSAIMLVAAIVAWTAAAQSSIVTVVEVPEGDVLVIGQGDARQRVRLFAVDAPESGQPFAVEARDWLAKQVLNKDVLLTFKESGEKTSEEGLPLVVAVLPDGQNLNEALVTLGYAWAYDRHALSARLKNLQVEAMQAKKGLWQDPAPLAPWDYREKHRGEIIQEEAAQKSRYADLEGRGTATTGAQVSVSDDDVLELRFKGKETPAETPRQYRDPAAPTSQPSRSSVLQDSYQPAVPRGSRTRDYSNVQILRTNPSDRPLARPNQAP